MERQCPKCRTVNWGVFTSSSRGTSHFYCKTCRSERAKNYSLRIKMAKGTHSNREWLMKLAEYDHCPECKRLWGNIPPRPDKRYKYVWTKDHILPLQKGGTNLIDNLQPLCYQCNFRKR